jgi:hypothetical protein
MREESSHSPAPHSEEGGHSILHAQELVPSVEQRRAGAGGECAKESRFIRWPSDENLSLVFMSQNDSRFNKLNVWAGQGSHMSSHH